MNNFDIIVIGGGASGMTAAVSAKRKNKNLKIAVIEKNEEPCKKILATGNGKCNITNRSISKNDFSDSQNGKIFSDLIMQKKESIKLFLDSLGIFIYEDNSGRIYPLTNSAKTVKNIFIDEAERCNIKIFTETEICKMEKESYLWKLSSKDGKEFKTTKVIFSVGGFAAPEFGTTGVSWKILQNMGINFNYAEPSLCPLFTENNIKSLKGLRVKADITAERIVENKSEILYTEKNGEVQFGENYISGVCIMNATAFIKKTDKSVIKLDLCSNYSENEIIKYIKREKIKKSDRKTENLLDGIVNRNLGVYILREVLKIDTNKKISEAISDLNIEKIAKTLKYLEFKNLKKGTWKQSQTTMGGIDSDEVKENLELKKLENIYVCGEMCDIHGKCGGYNLSWAWISGIIAGESASK